MVRCHLAGGAGTVAAIPRKPTGLGVRLSYDRQRGRPSERAAHFARGSWSTQAMARSTRTLVQTSCGPAASPHGKDQLPRYGKYSAAAYVPIDGSPSHVTHGDHGDVVRHVPPSLRSQAHVAQRSMSRARKATRPVRHRTRRMPPGSATPMIRHRALIEHACVAHIRMWARVLAASLLWPWQATDRLTPLGWPPSSNGPSLDREGRERKPSDGK